MDAAASVGPAATLLALIALTAGFFLSRLASMNGQAKEPAATELLSRWAKEEVGSAEATAQHAEQVTMLQSLLAKERAQVEQLSKLFNKRESELADLEETIETFRQAQERSWAEQKQLKATIENLETQLRQSVDDRLRVENAVELHGPVQLAKSQNDALAQLEKTGQWSDAIALLTVGCGTNEAAQGVFPLLMHAWNRQCIVDKERVCKDALGAKDSNEVLIEQLELALALPSSETTPIMKQCADKLHTLRVAGELQAAMEAENEKRLEKAIHDAEGLASTDAARAVLARLSRARRLEAAVNAPRPKSPSTLMAVLSDELWDWQQSEPTALLEQGLCQWTAETCGAQVRAALDNGDARALHLAVNAATAAGLGVEQVPELKLAAPLCDVNSTVEALQDALQSESPQALKVALVRAQAAGVEPALHCDDATETTSESSLSHVRAKCANLAFEARSKLLAIEAEHNLEVSDEISDDAVERLRLATLEVRRLLGLGWMSEPLSLAKVERIVRQRKAMSLVQAVLAARSDKGRDDLVELAAALEICEKNQVDKTSKDFVAAKAQHAIGIEHLLEAEGLSNEEHRKQLIAMGVEYLDDLGLLTEGDLRQAGVPRISVRKVLPRLLQVGAEAHQRAVVASVDFEAALKR